MSTGVGDHTLGSWRFAVGDSMRWPWARCPACMSQGAVPEVVKGSGVDLLTEHVADGCVGKHISMQKGQS